jgi:hypothetical protein
MPPALLACQGGYHTIPRCLPADPFAGRRKGAIGVVLGSE